MKTVWILLSLIYVASGTEKCYRKYGCFNDYHPFEDFPLPNAPGKLYVEFRLYTRLNRGDDDYSIITEDQTSIYFDVHKPTKVYVHGWFGDGEFESVLLVKDNLLDHGDYNVIMVDWSDGSQNVNYFQSASDTRMVGAKLAYLVRRHNQRFGLDPDDVHCIGLSLGAQTCGYMGKRLNTLGLPMARISGLDPAGPLFFTTSKEGRLYKGDAKFVDVIHSNGGETDIIFGIRKMSGDVDFYPNGGNIQAVCLEDWQSIVNSTAYNNPEKRSLVLGLCSHFAAQWYFGASLTARNCSFTAVPCKNKSDWDKGLCASCDKNKDCQYMGINADRFPTRVGTYYLKTLTQEPFCMD